MQIRQASVDAEVKTARALFREYADSLHVDLCFQGFAKELAGLPGLYAPPRGRLLIAWSDQEPAGCIALRPREGSICEMKRLFVRPAFRGQGLGRTLAGRMVAEARAIGYSSVVLDTLPSMDAALRLYERLGFVRRSAYYETPSPDIIFLELQL